MSGRSDSDDPFACFGSDDEGETDTVDAKEDEAALPVRDADSGVLAFHSGTEQALVAHVQNQLSSEEQQTPEHVLRIVDEFCLERHWMMHVGPEKAVILKDFVKHQCVLASRGANKNHSLTLVELGTYCGYSSIMFARTLSQLESEFHIYTVEVNPQYAAVAERLIHLAKLDEHITVLRLDITATDNQLTSLLKSKLGSDVIDFLFLDHDKDAYLSDLQRFERAGFVSRGTHVAADNVIFAQIDNYRTYINQLASRGVVESKLVESRLEYSEPDANESNQAKLVDGIELTVYITDPSE